jgi:orotidine-5'-phosphate decarboxylase
MNPIILALDTNDLDVARSWIEATNGAIKTYKAGLEFFLTFGAEGIRKLNEAGDFDLFLDLKLHDIPNTVGSATKSIVDLAPKFLTVHASGGSEMIRAAATAAPEIEITAVTILTSLTQQEVSNIGFAQPPLQSAVKLAQLASGSGARAIVCSPLEVAAIREAIGATPAIITPGVRPIGSALGDQQRVMTPREAMLAGSTYLVIGRPITSLHSEGAEAMRKKALEILDEATSA